MSFFRTSVESAHGYVPGEQPADGVRVIKLITNENPYPPSPKVARAIRAELAQDGARLRLYSDPLASSLRQAAAEVFGFEVGQILHGNGSDELLAILMRACLEEGEAIAYAEPTYSLYEVLAAVQGVRLETHPLSAAGMLPSELFESRAKLIFVTNPNAPLGVRHQTEELRRLARSVSGLVVIDEAYAEFAEENALELAKSEANVVVLRTFSKSRSLAGMRLGLLFGAANVIEQLFKVKDSYNLDRVQIVAGAAALKDEAWSRQQVEKVKATRTRLSQALGRLGFDVLPSEANFVFARLKSPAKAKAVFSALRDQGIFVRYFERPGLADGLRITVGTDAEIDALLAALPPLLAKG